MYTKLTQRQNFYHNLTIARKNQSAFQVLKMK